MEVGLEGCLDMLMLCACCLLLCTLKHTHKERERERESFSSFIVYNNFFLNRSDSEESEEVEEEIENLTREQAMELKRFLFN